MLSSKKEKADAAAAVACRMKAAALSAAKGLSRTQAERAATAAARDVNAHEQKEEGAAFVLVTLGSRKFDPEEEEHHHDPSFVL